MVEVLAGGSQRHQPLSRLMTFMIRVYALLLLAIGGAMIWGGAELIGLGGSFYYLFAGLVLVTSAGLLWMRRATGVVVYGLMLLATIVWALWEAGWNGWALMPRILSPIILGLPLLPLAVRRRLARRTPPWSMVRMIGAVAVAMLVGGALRLLVPPILPADPIYQTGMGQAARPAGHLPDNGDWLHYGNDLAGRRFSPAAQITPANVDGLKLAWSYQVDPVATRLEVTPLKIGRTLYLCNNFNDVIALDAETGRQQWRFSPGVDRSAIPTPVCRGLAYYTTLDTRGLCARRIITNTVDARLIALDAATGRRCPGFGHNGEVSLLDGMGDVPPGYYYPTSAPTLIQGRIVLGGWVMDGQYWGEPSGVIRAYDAVTGALAWAWDMGRPDRMGAPPPGEQYTRSTPNSWAPMSGDEALGLVYVPMGNPTPDSVGAQRRPFDERYGSAVVALDIATGRPRWAFQTVHHDLWDYDLPAQPTLVDYPTPRGIVRALIQPTKRGELFVLDRATGAPISPVVERPAPQRGAAPGERPAPNQPFSIGMPSFRGADLTERQMWGVTALDQLWCRLRFREARYDGPLTPPGLTPAVVAPGFMGGMEWGGVAIDATRHIAIINSMHLPAYLRLIPRAEATARGVKRIDNRNLRFEKFLVTIGLAQENTPYALLFGPFVSPLGIPCSQPPFGRLSAVDLPSGRLLWTQPYGTADELGPLGLRSHLPLTIGTPNMGGAVATAGGLFFIGSAQDRRLRAYETATGRERWQAPIPGGGVATPMTYISPQSGRQFVVLAVGHDGLHASGGGNMLMAYALPRKATR